MEKPALKLRGAEVDHIFWFLDLPNGFSSCSPPSSVFGGREVRWSVRFLPVAEVEHFPASKLYRELGSQPKGVVPAYPYSATSGLLAILGNQVYPGGTAIAWYTGKPRRASVDKYLPLPRANGLAGFAGHAIVVLVRWRNGHFGSVPILNSSNFIMQILKYCCPYLNSRKKIV